MLYGFNPFPLPLSLGQFPFFGNASRVAETPPISTSSRKLKSSDEVYGSIVEKVESQESQDSQKSKIKSQDRRESQKVRKSTGRELKVSKNTSVVRSLAHSLNTSMSRAPHQS